MRVDGFAPGGSDQRRFENALQEPYWLLWRVGIDTGLRIGDLLQMRVCDVLALVGGITVLEKKTGKTRKVRLSPVTAARLIAYTARMPLNGYVWDSPAKPGQPIARQSVWRVYKKAASGSKNIGTHSARKTFAQKLYKKTDLETVQETFDHKYPSTTLLYVINPRTKKNRPR